MFTSVSLDAPHDGKPKTRISWLLRQLADAPDHLRIEVHYPNVRDPERALLRDVRLKPERLLLAADPSREPRTFRLLLCRDLGMKRGNGTGSFVSEVEHQAVDFYRSVVQHLKSWRPPAPTLPPQEQEAIEVLGTPMAAGTEPAIVSETAAQNTDLPPSETSERH